jgi:hypothetical protein
MLPETSESGMRFYWVGDWTYVCTSTKRRLVLVPHSAIKQIGSIYDMRCGALSLRPLARELTTIGEGRDLMNYSNTFEGEEVTINGEPYELLIVEVRYG